MTYATASSRDRDGLGIRALRVLGDVVATVTFAVAAELDRRRTARMLAFDDVMLKDIGVTRGDVEGSLLTRLGEKASHRLAERRDERRLAELASIREARRDRAA